MHRKLRAFLALAAVNAVLLVTAAIGLELTFGNWFASYSAPYGAVFDRTFKYDQHFYAPHGIVTYTRDVRGLRGAREPLHNIELVTVGGSTTDQRFITDGHTWQDVIRRQTGLAVANAGVDGMSSGGHVVALEQWLHRIPGLRARHYLHYIGVNDALLVHYSALHDKSAADKVTALGRRQSQASGLSRIIRARSALVRTYLRLVSWMQGPPTVGTSTPAVDDTTPAVVAQADRSDIHDYIETVYRPNLRKLIDHHRRRGETAILVSQPAHPLMVQKVGAEMLVRDRSMALWALALHHMNEATDAICAEYAADCRFIDLARLLHFAPHDFYDFVHATPAGAQRIGAFLAAELLSILGRPRS